MGQDGSKIPLKRRVEDEKVKLLCKENRAAMKLSSSEIKTLKQLYQRLAALSPEDEYIDKQTFLNYFPLEGVLAERLFATFDKDRNNVIDYEEFLGGLALCLCGTIDEKFQLVFDLYNIDDGDGVSEEELAIVLKSTFMAASAIVDPVRHILIGDEVEDFNIDEHVQKVVRDAFEECDTSQTGKLSPEEFRTWAENHSYILDVIFGHRSFIDKQKISENITAATMKAAEMNSLRYQTQTWIDTDPITSQQSSEISRGYAKATYLWSPVFPVMLKSPKARSEQTVCVYQGSLYLLGGRGVTTYKDFWKYDLALNSWTEITNDGERPSQIFGHTVVVYKGSMYIYGGEFKSCESFLWKYTFDSDVWEQLISREASRKKLVPGNRRHHSAVIYKNKMYVYGGIIDIRGCTPEMWTFNFMNCDWELVSQAPKNNPGARYEHSAVVYNHVMWVMGGLANYQPKNDLWKWNFGTSSWSKVRTRGGPFPIHGHRAVKCGNGMIIFGGSINGEYDNVIWKFDFECQNWSVITPHGNVSPSVRSSPALLTLSAFLLPLLPPQSIQNTKPNLSTRNVDVEHRPRTTPEYKSKQSSLNVYSRQWSLSSDSVYQSPRNIDKRFSAKSVDDMEGENVTSAFTNPSFTGSIEEHQFLKCETSSAGSLDQRENSEENINKTVQWNLKSSTDKERRNENCEESLPSPREGLCIFLIGGKYCDTQDMFHKGVDIWRCDVSKRRKRSNKVTRIKVQTAGRETFPVVRPPRQEQVVQREQLPHTSNTGSINTFHRESTEDLMIYQNDHIKTYENDSLKTDESSTCYGDLIVTDLIS